MATYTVLVADDSLTVQRVVEMACAADDVEVIGVGDGERAIARIAEHPPDLVLADIAMPGRSGYEVAAFVKARPHLAHIPVVLLAGMFDSTDEVTARGIGCAEVLVKPLKPQHVVARVRHWLSAPAVGTAVHSTVDEAGASSPVDSAEEYFSRLDAAFRSLGRPSGAGAGAPGPTGEDGPAGGAGVPTLQELLERLPQETRTMLTPPRPAPVAAGDTTAIVDAIASRVVDEIARRSDLLDALAQRLVARRATGERA